MAQEAQQNFMILFDTVTSPNNELLLACSTYGDIFIWNVAPILENKPAKNKLNNTNSKYSFEDNDDFDIIEYENQTQNNHTFNTHQMNHNNVPSFVFRPFAPNIREPIYRMESANNLLFIGTFQSLFIYKWEEIMQAMQANTDTNNSLKTMHLNDLKPVSTYFAPQIEDKYGAKSRYVEINAISVDQNSQNSVFLGTGHCDIFALDIAKLELVNTLSAHSDYVLDLSINSKHSLLTSSANDGLLKVWDLRKNECIVSFNDKNSDSYFGNCCELHDNGRYIVGGFGVKNAMNKKEKNKICLFELNMQSMITEIVNESNNYIPQIVKFSNVWRPSNQSNLSVIAGYNNSDLHLFHQKYSNGKKNQKNITITTLAKSIWSVNVCQNIAFVCGTSKYIDLIANTGNVIASLSV